MKNSKTISILFAISFAAIIETQFAQAETFKYDQDQSEKIIRALMYSGVKPKIGKKERSLHVPQISFRAGNGRDCDNETSPFCGLGDPMSVQNGPNKEIVQLEHVLHEISGPKLKEIKMSNGDVAAGTYYWRYGAIDCKWQVQPLKRPRLLKAACEETFGSADLYNENH